MMARRLRELLGHSAIYGVGSIAPKIAAILLLPVYTTYLGQGDYGQVELVLALVTVLAILTKLGLVNALFRFFFDDEALENPRPVIQTIFWALLATTTLAAGLVVACAEPIGALLFGGDGAATRDLVRIGALGVWVSGNYELMTALYRVQKRPVSYSIASFVNLGLTIAFTLVFIILLDLKAEGLLLGNFLGTFTVYLFLLAAQRDWLGLTFERPLLRQMLAFGLPLMPAHAAMWAVNLVDRPIVASIAGMSALGVYAISYKMAQAIMLVVAAFQLSWPPFALSIRDDEEARQTYAIVLALYSAVLAWAVATLGLLAPWLVRLLTQEPFWGATVAVVPLAAAAALYGGYHIAVIGTVRMKRNRYNWVVVSVGAAVEVGLLYALVPDHGIAGAAWASFAAFGTMFVLIARRSQQVFPVPYDWLRIARPAVIAAVVLAVATQVPDTGAAAFAQRLALVLAFPVLLAAVGFFPGEELARMRTVLRGMRRRGRR